MPDHHALEQLDQEHVLAQHRLQFPAGIAALGGAIDQQHHHAHGIHLARPALAPAERRVVETGEQLDDRPLVRTDRKLVPQVEREKLLSENVHRVRMGLRVRHCRASRVNSLWLNELYHRRVAKATLILFQYKDLNKKGPFLL